VKARKLTYSGQVMAKKTREFGESVMQGIRPGFGRNTNSLASQGCRLQTL